MTFIEKKSGGTGSESCANWFCMYDSPKKIGVTWGYAACKEFWHHCIHAMTEVKLSSSAPVQWKGTRSYEVGRIPETSGTQIKMEDSFYFW